MSAQTIGRYRVAGELGKGAMGVVYRAEDPAIGRSVAIKMIRLNALTSEDEIDQLRMRLLREARSAGILSHPGIVTIYDIAEEEGQAYVFMEFVDGDTLENRMRSDSPPDRLTILQILKQTAIALDYAHSKGIVHRDIKPANIMISVRGEAKITDFGVAKIMSQQMTQAGMVLGTPFYMSPEQIQGSAIDGRTDQYALGVIAYELLTGRRPYAAESLATLLLKVVQESAPRPQEINPSLGPEVGGVFQKIFAKDASDRYPSCVEFTQALETALERTPAWRPIHQRAPRRAPGETAPAPPSPLPGLTSGPSTTLQAAAPQLPPELPPTVVTPTAAEPPASKPTPMQSAETQLQSATSASTDRPESQPRAESVPPPPPPSIETMKPARAMEEPVPEHQAAPAAAEPVSQTKKAPHHKKRQFPVMAAMVGAAVLVAAVLIAGFLAGDSFLGGETGQTPQLAPVPGEELAATATNADAPDPTATEATLSPKLSGPPPTPESGGEAKPTPAPSPPTQSAPKAPTPAPVQQPSVLAVQVTSTPPGATVVFDNDSTTGCVTPCSVEVSAGRHVMRAGLSGYREALRIRNISSAEEIDFKLERMAGSLALSTTPPGATIRINGKVQPKKTPAIFALEAGVYEVELELEGFTLSKDTVTIQDQVMSNLNINWSDQVQR